MVQEKPLELDPVAPALLLLKKKKKKKKNPVKTAAETKSNKTVPQI